MFKTSLIYKVPLKRFNSSNFWKICKFLRKISLKQIWAPLQNLQKLLNCSNNIQAWTISLFQNGMARNLWKILRIFSEWLPRLLKRWSSSKNSRSSSITTKERKKSKIGELNLRQKNGASVWAEVLSSQEINK